MIPHGAPTTWFSASWQIDARRIGSIPSTPSARAVAISSAALDDTPTDWGTSDETERRARGRFDHAVADEHQRDTEHVVRPTRVMREGSTDLGIRKRRERRDLVGGQLHRSYRERLGGLRDARWS